MASVCHLDPTITEVAMLSRLTGACFCPCRLLSCFALVVTALPYKKADEPLAALAHINAVIAKRGDSFPACILSLALLLLSEDLQCCNVGTCSADMLCTPCMGLTQLMRHCSLTHRRVGVGGIQVGGEDRGQLRACGRRRLARCWCCTGRCRQ